MRRIAVVVAIGVCACGGSTGPEVSLSGDWLFVGYFANAQLLVVCDGAGTVTIVQSDASFTGGLTQTGSCRGPDGVTDNTTWERISEGRIRGSSVSYRIGGCSYAGELAGSNRIVGSTTCETTHAGERYTFSGQWHAGRR